MKKLIYILLLSVLAISNYSYAEELYKENIYIAKYELENKKRRAEFVAEIDRGIFALSIDNLEETTFSRSSQCT
jgi:hypothetical protein